MQSSVTDMVQSELLMIFIIFAFGLFMMQVAKKIQVPDIALFIIIGILIGPPGLHLISQPSNSVAYQFIIYLGSILILFDGGRAIDMSVLKKVWRTLSLLSILGVLIMVVVVGLVAHWVVGIPIVYALLLAAVISPTDPATLIPVFKQVKIRDKVRQTVESESAFNDATGSILTITLLGIILSQAKVSIGAGVGEFVLQAGGGLLLGAIVGYIGLLLKSQHRLGFFHEYSHIVGAMMAIGAYLAAESIGASGFMATFTAGIISGNPQLFNLELHRRSNRNLFEFGETTTLIMRTLIFMLLGTQVQFSSLSHFWWQGLIIVLVFMFVARPLAVMACTFPDRKAKWEWKEILFMFWVRETGVIPAALSGMILVSGVKYGNLIFSVTFMAILITILIQASTTGIVAKKLGLIVKPSSSQE
ncbi:cation:proton antiporter [Pullulanibacillus sp. KACC 23026]|uniref:cation:proton antiporter n=1 Tax=Pullulanibacillus sp. KACC 23026 TaxID=3028315 RepID=UPI0023B0A7F2|nr:cation:proton antiporter [Pullulanibacillus sp. KACC 23026]WEG14199.1 cation:proton antiporter [Pullulanibacillus sp. KACC 23026]